MNIARLANSLLLGFWWFFSPLPVIATTIFDNSVNSQQANLQTQSFELGDEIHLAGTARRLTNFSCGYILWTTDPQPDVTARLRFYLNDAADEFGYLTPGTVLYDSDWFAIAPAHHGTLTLSVGSQLPAEGLFLPASDITWSIQFQGVTNGTAGVRIFSPPVVGSDTPYCWYNAGYGWFQTTPTHGESIDFLAVLEATEVPEPSPAVLLLCAALVSSLRVRRRRI